MHVLYCVCGYFLGAEFNSLFKDPLMLSVLPMQDKEE